MSRISGIIYSSAFQVTEIVEEMHPLSSSSFDYFRHKNLELGAWDTPIATNQAHTIHAFLEGEIYNADLLREELTRLGFHFKTQTDAEVIVHAYDAWKEEFISKLNGPFALAVFDEEREILLLARDRIGQKSLYWTAQGDYWLFSSEIKGLLASGVVPQRASNEALASYLYFGFIPQDLSPISGVSKLLPCHYLKIDLSRRSTIQQYWSLSHYLHNKLPLTRDEIYDQLGERLEDAVRLSLPKKGQVGSFLVGNLGSSAMSWFLTHVAPRERIQAYSSVFEEPESQELNIANAIAEQLSLKHKTSIITPDEAIDALPTVVWHLDEPVADPYVMQTWHMGRLASKECHQIYADLGWEEMIGGSSRYFSTKEDKPSLAFFFAQLPSFLRDGILLPLLKFCGSDYLYRILRNIEINREQITYLKRAALFHGRTRKKASPLLYKAFDPEVFTQRFHRLGYIPGAIDPSLYYDAKTELPDRLLIQYERLLAPHQMEVINPFLDYRLVELLACIPEEIKFESDEPGAILRNLMTKLCHQCPSFPERSDSFLDTWRLNGRFRDIFELLMQGKLVDEGLISGRWIRQQLGYPYLTPLMFKQLWAITVLEVWFRFYVDRPIRLHDHHIPLEELLSH